MELGGLYAEPKEQLRPTPPGVFWHSHYLEDPLVAETSGCEAAAGSSELHLSNYTGSLAQPLNPAGRA